MSRDWRDDPEVQARMREQRVRNGIIRSAIIWTPLALAMLGLFLFFAFDVLTDSGHGGTWFLLVVLLIFTGLFGAQAMQSLLDLRVPPEEADATVANRWTRSDSIVLKSHYVRLDNKQILRGDLVMLDGIKSGDRVHVRYYRHSAVLVSLEKLPQEETPATAG